MRIGFLSLPLSGHLNPMTALARKLQARGNEVVFISVPDAEAAVRAANLEFVPFCEEEYPLGSIAENWSSVAKLHGEEVVRHSSRELLPGIIKAAFDHLPAKIAETGVEALVFDKILLLPGTCGDEHGHSLRGCVGCAARRLFRIYTGVPFQLAA